MLFRATPVAYESSQARDQVGDTATSLHTAMPDPSLFCDLHDRPRESQILNPLSGARDQTRIVMDPSRVCFHPATKGTPHMVLFLLLLLLLK